MKATGIRAFVFLTGCFAYGLMEITARGYTHWTMALTGGLILTVLYEINKNLFNAPMWQKCLLGSLIITSVEFTVGVIDNIIMGWQVWDYSDMPFNILGQICLPFTVLWFFVCIPAMFICERIRLKFT